MDLAVQRRQVDPELLGVRADVGERDLRGLLHHVAELAGELQARLAVVGSGFDVEHIATEAGDGKAGGHARHRGALGRFRGEPRTAKVANEIRLVDRQRLGIFRQLRRGLAQRLGEQPLELPHTRFAGVVCGDLAQCFVGHLDLLGRQRARSRCRGSRKSRAMATLSSSV